jgi:hypothetical protein
MEKKDFIKIINEEISEFDFLGNNKQLKEEENYELLKNEDLQKQFICDSLLRLKEKIKVDTLDNVISDDTGGAIRREPNYLNIEINTEIEYKYDPLKEPLKFSLYFDGDNVPISVDSDYDPGQWGATTDDAIAPSGGDWINYIDWSEVRVRLFTIDGDEVKFTAFEKAPIKIQDIFVREYCESGIEKSGDYSVNLKNTDKIQNIPYC